MFLISHEKYHSHHDFAMRFFMPCHHKTKYTEKNKNLKPKKSECWKSKDKVNKLVLFVSSILLFTYEYKIIINPIN